MSLDLARALIAAVLLTALAVGCGEGEVSAPLPTTSVEFTEGQVWRYRTRAGEEDSRLVIGKVDTAPGIGVTVHVKLTRLRLRSPAAPDVVQTELAHAPIAETYMAASVTALTDETADLEGFREGYEIWLRLFVQGEAGVFTITPAEVVDYVEAQFAQRQQ